MADKEKKNGAVDIWVEQLSGPAKALRTVAGKPNGDSEWNVVEKHLPDLESDTLDRFVFLTDYNKRSRPVIVLAYAPNLELLQGGSEATSDCWDVVSGEGLEPSNGRAWKETVTYPCTEGFQERQRFVLQEIGRKGNNGCVKFLPVMANTILFVWNRDRLRSTLDKMETPLHLDRCHGGRGDDGGLNGWTWSAFQAFLRDLTSAGAERPLAMCGSVNGGIAFYEWSNFIGGQEDGDVIFKRELDCPGSLKRHGWWHGGEDHNQRKTHVENVLKKNSRFLARYAQMLGRFAHQDFLEMDQELQLDLLLNGDAVAGFVWADQLAGLDGDGLDALGVWPIPGKRAVVSGAAAMVPRGCNGDSGKELEVAKSLWTRQEELCASGMIPAKLKTLYDHLVEGCAFGRTWADLVKDQDNGDQLRVYRAVWESLLGREPIVLEGGPLAHRIGAKYTESIRRIWRRITDQSRYKESVRDIVNGESHVLFYEMSELLEANPLIES